MKRKEKHFHKPEAKSHTKHKFVFVCGCAATGFGALTLSRTLGHPLSAAICRDFGQSVVGGLPLVLLEVLRGFWAAAEL